MAKATAIFDGDDSRLQAAISRINKSLLGVQKKFSKFAALGSIVAVGGALTALGVGIKNALDVGGHFTDLSAQTGVAVKDLVVLEQEFRNAGKSGEDVGRVINKMQKSLAEGTADGLLSQLGVDLESLKKQSPAEQFHAIGEAINGIQNPSEKAAASMQIFGKSSAELLSMFSSKGFGEAAAQVGDQAQILNRDAALFDDVSDKLALAGVKTQGFFVGVADRVAPVLRSLLDRFATLDLTGLGQQLGDIIATFAESISSGNIWNIVAYSIEIQLAKVLNFFGDGLLAAVNGVSTALGGKKLAVNSFFDVDDIERSLARAVQKSFGAAQIRRDKALAAVPQAHPAVGAPILDLTSGGGGGVSALQAIGGAFGGGGGSQLLDAARTTNEILQKIYGALGSQPGSAGVSQALYG